MPTLSCCREKWEGLPTALVMDIVKVAPARAPAPVVPASQAYRASAPDYTPTRQSSKKAKSKSVKWQAYVDDALLKTGQVSQAAIFGLNGVQWAASVGFKVTQEQVQKLLASITGDPSSVRREGIHIGSQSYIYLRSEMGRSIYGRKGADTGVCVVKSKRAILIGTYGAGIQPGNCNSVMEKLADYLIQHNL